MAQASKGDRVSVLIRFPAELSGRLEAWCSLKRRVRNDAVIEAVERLLSPPMVSNAEVAPVVKESPKPKPAAKGLIGRMRRGYDALTGDKMY